MWSRERAAAELAFQKAGLGERLTSWSSRDGALVNIICRLPYVRIGSGEAEYVVFSLALSQGFVSALAYNDTTGRKLYTESPRKCSVETVEALVTDLLSWWKENRSKPGFA